MIRLWSYSKSLYQTLPSSKYTGAKLVWPLLCVRGIGTIRLGNNRLRKSDEKAKLRRPMKTIILNESLLDARYPGRL